ncbi:hypothetical protein BTN49_1998 [Candidatus Enterovibrio escicola]|uniref:Uncharacterized protein n=1 Tax=Candidatus Enterovibrio escicola TaxID=1927127 RepID=A0A2A5T278_9GAMM|nr:hypothetical protein BTN49_1998 [Candidatus Enterovibrio escacola]
MLLYGIEKECDASPFAADLVGEDLSERFHEKLDFLSWY